MTCFAFIIAVLLSGETRSKNVESLTVDSFAEGLRVTATSSRPLFQISKWLEARFGVAIDYEDPDYDKADSMDITSPDWRKQHPNQEGVSVPNIRTVQIEVSKTATSPSDGIDAMRRAVDQMNKVASNYRFSLVVSSSNQIAVIGTSNKQAVPIGSVIISGAPRKSTGDVELRRLAEACSAKSGFPIAFAQVPWNLLATTSLDKREGFITCRDGLQALLGRLAYLSSYSLTHGTDSPEFVINFSPLYRTAIGKDGQSYIAPVHR